MTNFSRWSWLRTISQRVVLCERRDQSPLAPKVKKGLCSSAETRVRAAAMSAIALTLGSLRSQGRLIENSICDSPAACGERRSVNAFLTINRAKIAEWSLSIVSRVKRGDYPWTPVRCLTFETGVLRPPRRRLAPAAGIRGGKQQRWSISRQVRAGRREADFRVSAKSAPS